MERSPLCAASPPGKAETGISGAILSCAALPKSISLDAVIVAEPRSKGNVEPLVRLAARDMATVDALILDRMQSQVPVIPLLAEHLISAGGKRLRPLLTLAAARASGATGDITPCLIRRMPCSRMAE